MCAESGRVVSNVDRETHAEISATLHIKKYRRQTIVNAAPTLDCCRRLCKSSIYFRKLAVFRLKSCQLADWTAVGKMPIEKACNK